MGFCSARCAATGGLREPSSPFRGLVSLRSLRSHRFPNTQILHRAVSPAGRRSACATLGLLVPPHAKNPTPQCLWRNFANAPSHTWPACLPALRGSPAFLALSACHRPGPRPVSPTILIILKYYPRFPYDFR